MKKFKIYSSCHPSQIPAISSALPRSHSRDFPHENFFPKLSIYVGHKFNTVRRLVRNFHFM